MGYAGRFQDAILFHLVQQSVVELTNSKRRSIHWLCTDNPAIFLPLLNPLCIALPTSKFSSPSTEHTLEENPYFYTAAKNSVSTVAAELFVSQL